MGESNTFFFITSTCVVIGVIITVATRGCRLTLKMDIGFRVGLFFGVSGLLVGLCTTSPAR